MATNRTRGLMPPDATRLGEVPLSADEVSLVMRMRGPRDALERFASMTAAERGEIIARVLRGC